jgi:hypothetical protein
VGGAPEGGEEPPTSAPPRDAITGEPLSEEAVYQLTIFNRAYPPAEIPRQLHVSRPMPYTGRVEDRKYWHGAPDWSSGLVRLVGGAIPAELLEADRRWREWWTDDYVVARLRTRLGAKVMDALLAWKRDDEHYWLVTRRFRQSDGWLRRQLREATAIVRAEYLPREDRPLRRRPKGAGLPAPQ